LTLIDGTLIVIEKNPAVDIYSINRDNLDTVVKKKAGFESFVIAHLNWRDMSIFQPDNITGWSGNDRQTVYSPFSCTFNWLVHETERSLDKNTYFNYRLYGDGTCQNFVHYFMETLARNNFISRRIINEAKIFYMQSVCRMETLMIEFVGSPAVPLGNLLQTSFYLIIIGKRQYDGLLSSILDYAYENNIKVQNFFNSPQGVNSKQLLLLMARIFAILIQTLPPISQGGYSSKSSRKINQIIF
jgi:hypothetical protein